MTILVNPHNEQEQKVLLAFLDSLHYEYQSANQFGKSQTIYEYNNELDDAVARVSEGQYTMQEDLEKEMQSW